MSNVIEVESLSKVYRRGTQRIVALEGLDLQVPAGSIFGFIGPNGAGKSTTIKILVGLVRPGGGTARILGQPCGTVDSRQHIGYLPETAVYHDFMTVAELIRIHAVLADIPDSDIPTRCERVLRRVRLEHRQQSRVRELSKGMQQRFGLAQALLSDPQVLILDEPTSGLDPMSQREVKDILVDLRSQGLTIFFSSHQLTDMEAFCDQVGILHQGRLLTCAPMQELLGGDGGMRVAFTASDTAVSTLRSQGIEAVTSGTEYGVTVTQAGVYEVMEALRQQGAELQNVQPIRRHLEDAYFELVAASEPAS